MSDGWTCTLDAAAECVCAGGVFGNTGDSLVFSDIQYFAVGNLQVLRCGASAEKQIAIERVWVWAGVWAQADLSERTCFDHGEGPGSGI